MTSPVHGDPHRRRPAYFSGASERPDLSAEELDAFGQENETSQDEVSTN